VAEINEKYPEFIVIIVSGMNQIDPVKCMKQGAFLISSRTSEEDRWSPNPACVPHVEMQRDKPRDPEPLLYDRSRIRCIEGMV
jgi:hypothetical protein